MKKIFLLLVLVFTVFSFTIGGPVSAQTNQDVEGNSLKIVNFNQGDIDKVHNVVGIINEIEKSELDMENLSGNSKEEINKLSQAAQEFYFLYEEKVDELNINYGENVEIEVLNFINEVSNDYEMNSSETAAIQAASLGGVYKYYLSNQQVKDIAAAAGVNGTFWGLMAAIAKKFAKKPTYITALIVAVPALGASLLTACNRKGKGIVIKDIRVGATHSWSCYSQ
ncbi:hypothetical protein [Gracilibacillus suaedae]|uniref:hypothetical protein n=1 Tax=Gracilibacillus suaedae TaxID=2820273 RepID=UPI001ABDBE1C|nr:hypothetical protein [Gracilibacillus suaedae]